MMKQNLLLFCFPLAMVVGGCGQPSKKDLPGQIDPLTRLPMNAEISPTSAVVETRGELTLRDALSLALMRSPKLEAVSLEIRMAEARELQSRLLPNPEIEIEAEEFAGSESGKGLDTAEYCISLSQLIELGGKRSARSRIARIDTKLAAWDYQAERLAVLTETTLGFIDVLSAQEGYQLKRDIVGLSEKTLAVVNDRVEGGKVSPLEKIKAQVELANARVDLEKSGSELRSARKRLAAVWGGTVAHFTRAAGNMNRVSEIPKFESLQALLKGNPHVARWAQEMQQRLAALARERAARVPDLTLAVGLLHSEESNQQGLVVGFSLPLPLFDRNQGGVLEAGHSLAQARQLRRAAEVNTALALAESYETLAAAGKEVTGLEKQVLPGALKAFKAIHLGYQKGKFNYLEIIDAQRTLFEARSHLLEARARYHRALALVESLIGVKLDSLHEQKRKDR
jgi:outer membrane protein, heavy metal efflux system